MANWPPVDPNDLSARQQRRPDEPGDRVQLRTGLDLQGVHRLRGAGRKAGDAGQPTFTLPPSDPGRRPDDRRRRAARDRNDERRPDPRPLLERRRGDDRRSSSAPTKFSKWIDRFGFGQQDRRPVPRRGKRDRAEARRILGLDDGQPADRPGRGGDADADGRRLHGDRRRRHPQAAAADQAGRRTADPRAEGAPGDQAAGGDARCGKCSRACWPRAAPPPRSASPATRWPARPAPPRWPKTAATRKRKYVASFIGFAPAQDPKLLAAVIVDQPQGEIYGGSVAAPAFGKIAEFACRTSGWRPNEQRLGDWRTPARAGGGDTARCGVLSRPIALLSASLRPCPAGPALAGHAPGFRQSS